MTNLKNVNPVFQSVEQEFKFQKVLHIWVNICGVVKFVLVVGMVLKTFQSLTIILVCIGKEFLKTSNLFFKKIERKNLLSGTGYSLKKTT